MNVAVVGLGYVGIANLLLFSSNYNVWALDIDESKVNMINNNFSLQYNKNIVKHLMLKREMWKATIDSIEAYQMADYIIICLPTDYDPRKDCLNTYKIEEEICKINNINSKATIVIRSTVPIGYCETLNLRFSNSIIYCPEFLREEKIYEDSFFPSRLVLGGEKGEADRFIELLKKCVKNSENVRTIKANYQEAESIKLFSNAYLAMRVAYFNELDMYAEQNKLDSRKIIKGVCADNRIGDYYNNPSFGYGGYCLPKDTSQLIYEFGKIPHSIINSIRISNKERIQYIAKNLLESTFNVIGVYRIITKTASDNFRNSSTLEIIEILKNSNKEIIMYEPLLDNDEYRGIKVYSSFEQFCLESDIILANRLSSELDNVIKKVYTRDLFELN